MADHDAPTPQRIFQALNGFQTSAALKGAIDLGLFTALGSERMPAQALARALGASERGVRILCDFLTIGGLLHKQGAEYRSSPDAALFLDEKSPAYVGSAARFVAGPEVTAQFSDIAAVVRRGGTLLDGQGSVEPDNPLWVEFARCMAPVMQPAADFIGELVTRDLAGDRPLKVLDVAAGHGAFGIAVARRHPAAEVVAVDWPAVLEVAAENATRAGVAGRHRRLPGNAFEVDYGEGFHVVLLTNFLHHFDVPTCTTLMRKVHGALHPGGRAVTLEFVPNDDRVTPPEQAAFALTMLVSTAAGDAYTFKQLETVAAEAGFAGSELHRMEGSRQSVIVSTKGA